MDDHDEKEEREERVKQLMERARKHLPVQKGDTDTKAKAPKAKESRKKK